MMILLLHNMLWLQNYCADWTTLGMRLLCKPSIVYLLFGMRLLCKPSIVLISCIFSFGLVVKNNFVLLILLLYVVFILCIIQQGVEGVKSYGIEKLIQIAAAQLSDQLPESREAARTLLLELQNVYEKSNGPAPSTVSEQQEIGSWEHFCHSKLSPLSAQAVLRVTNVGREGLVLGS